MKTNPDKSHSFSVNEAVAYGPEKAILLANLRFWLEKNQANEKHEHDGYVWTYNSGVAFSRLFPYFSSSKIKRLLKEMERDGLIITGNYNKSAYDRTKWYTMAEFSIGQSQTTHCSNMDNGLSKVRPPIPDINTDSKPDTKTLMSAKPDQPTDKTLAIDIFNYWRTTMGKSEATCKFTDKRKKAVLARLKDGYAVEFIKEAIDGCKADPFSMGQNDRCKPFNDLELICRTGEKLEQFTEKQTAPRKTAEIIDLGSAGGDWHLPENRNIY